MKREDEAAAAEPVSPPKSAGILSLLAALIVSLGVGGAVGMFVLGPRVSPIGGAPAAGGHEAPAPKKSSHHGEPASALFPLESLVVNPAGSNGTRFLIVSLAVQPTTPEGLKALEAAEPQVRDRLLQVLAAKTVDQLASIATRDSLKAEIISAIDETVPAADVQTLFMPQYVLQ
ncbi:MAG: flagellar basal body-associated FliL family protein [Longimicrobiales bacterium]